MNKCLLFRSDDGLTPVHIAAAWGRIEILELLLSCGGDPEARDIDQKTPFDYAKEEGFIECLNLLKSYLIPFSPTKQEKQDCTSTNLVLGKYKLLHNFLIQTYLYLLITYLLFSIEHFYFLSLHYYLNV